MGYEDNGRKVIVVAPTSKYHGDTGVYICPTNNDRNSRHRIRLDRGKDYVADRAWFKFLSPRTAFSEDLPGPERPMVPSAPTPDHPLSSSLPWDVTSVLDGEVEDTIRLLARQIVRLGLDPVMPTIEEALEGEVERIRRVRRESQS